MTFNNIYKWSARVGHGLNLVSDFVISTFVTFVPFLLVYNLILFFNGVQSYGYFDIKLFFNFADDTMRNNTLLFLMSDGGRNVLKSCYDFTATIQMLSTFPAFVSSIIGVPLFAVTFVIGTGTYVITIVFLFATLITCDVLDALVVVGRLFTNPTSFFVQRNPLTYISL